MMRIQSDQEGAQRYGAPLILTSKLIENVGYQEATVGFEPTNEGFADPCTAKKEPYPSFSQQTN